MRSIVYAAVLLILFGGYWFFSGSYSTETFVERARRDDASRVAKDDPDMAAAFRKARETLPEFLVLARAPRPTIDHFARSRLGFPRAMTAANSSGYHPLSLVAASTPGASTTRPAWLRR